MVQNKYDRDPDYLKKQFYYDHLMAIGKMNYGLII